MCDEDLPAVDDLCKRDGLVGLPVANGLAILDKDHVVIFGALEVDFAGLSVTAHIC